MAEITIASYDKAVSPAFTGATATLKIWYDRQFLTSDNEIVLAGDVENPNLTVACTVGGGGFTITIPQFPIDSTIDGVPPVSRVTAILFDENGIHRETVLSNFKIPNTPTSTTWPALFIYNQGGLVTLPDEYYTKNQVNALLNVISVGGTSVTSVEYESAVSRISGNSAQMTSADNALSSRIEVVSNAVSVVSNALSALSQTNSAEHAALSARITSVAGAGGGGSVTSNELSAVSAAAQSGIATLSARITNLVLGSISDVNINAPTSAQYLGYNSLIGQWENYIIPAESGSATSQELSAAAAGLSVRVDSVANAVSVLSNANSAAHVSINAGVTSLDNRATSLANAISVLSQELSALSNANSAAHVSLDSRATSLANAISAVSNALSVLSQTNSAAHVSLDGRATSLANAISVVSNALSAKTISSLIGVSITGAADGQVMMYNLSDAKWHASTAPGGAGSVTSQELSVEAAALSGRIDSVANAISVVSNARSATDAGLSTRIDSVANAVSVLSVAVANTSNDRSVVSVYAQQVSNNASIVSNYASIVSATAATMPQHAVRIVSNTQSNNTSVLAGISGLVLTLGADETWAIEGMILVSTSVATAGLRLGVSAGALSLPRFIRFNRVSTGQSAGIMGAAGFLQASGTSTFLSLANLGGVANGVMFNAIVNAASASNFEMMFAGIASTAASPVHIMPGSYLLGHRLK